MSRILCWFSCGIASTIATKIALEEADRDTKVYYCEPGNEHPDNQRYLRDCAEWFGHEIIQLKSEKYNDAWDVWEKTKWLVGVQGARCTVELKKKMRYQVEQPDDIQVWGYDITEKSREDRHRNNFPEINFWSPLIDRGLNKKDCLKLVEDAGIEIPAMYKLGYKNNNCIGCVKGQSGYWNKIRVDFPEVFARMAKLERTLDVALNKSYAGDGLRKRVFLDELPPDAGNYKSELGISCGLVCEQLELKLDEDKV